MQVELFAKQLFCLYLSVFFKYLLCELLFSAVNAIIIFMIWYLLYLFNIVRGMNGLVICSEYHGFILSLWHYVISY